MEVERGEFERLRVVVDELGRTLHATRVTLQGEHGTNGVKESLNRAHAAIGKLGVSVRELMDQVAQVKEQSSTGDKDMEILVLNKLTELNEKMDQREKAAEQVHKDLVKERAVEKRWLAGQTIVILIAVLTFIGGALL